MKLLLVHLSDFHLTNSTQGFIERQKFISDAVKNLEYELNLCLVVISGDIAYSGKEDEYLVAWEFLQTLAEELGESLSGFNNQTVPVFIVASPGNHDCDFSGAGNMRTILLDNILQNYDQARDPDISKACLEPQTQFFRFLDDIEGQPRTSVGTGFNDLICYQYSFNSESKTIKVICCNTAWLSRLTESQGHLYFPSEAIPNPEASD